MKNSEFRAEFSIYILSLSPRKQFDIFDTQLVGENFPCNYNRWNPFLYCPTLYDTLFWIFNSENLFLVMKKALVESTEFVSEFLFQIGLKGLWTSIFCITFSYCDLCNHDVLFCSQTRYFQQFKNCTNVQILRSVYYHTISFQVWSYSQIKHQINPHMHKYITLEYWY